MISKFSPFVLSPSRDSGELFGNLLERNRVRTEHPSPLSPSYSLAQDAAPASAERRNLYFCLAPVAEAAKGFSVLRPASAEVRGKALDFVCLDSFGALCLL